MSQSRPSEQEIEAYRQRVLQLLLFTSFYRDYYSSIPYQPTLRLQPENKYPPTNEKDWANDLRATLMIHRTASDLLKKWEYGQEEWRNNFLNSQEEAKKNLEAVMLCRTSETFILNNMPLKILIADFSAAEHMDILKIAHSDEPRIRQYVKAMPNKEALIVECINIAKKLGIKPKFKINILYQKLSMINYLSKNSENNKQTTPQVTPVPNKKSQQKTTTTVLMKQSNSSSRNDTPAQSFITALKRQSSFDVAAIWEKSKSEILACEQDRILDALFGHYNTSFIIKYLDEIQDHTLLKKFENDNTLTRMIQFLIKQRICNILHPLEYAYQKKESPPTNALPKEMSPFEMGFYPPPSMDQFDYEKSNYYDAFEQPNPPLTALNNTGMFSRTAKQPTTEPVKQPHAKRAKTKKSSQPLVR